jgi:hypothetical protein
VSAREPWADVALRGIRAAGREDRFEVAGLLARMDRDGLYERHFAHGEAPNHALLRRLDDVDGINRVALLAVGADDTAIGHAEYVATDLQSSPCWCCHLRVIAVSVAHSWPLWSNSLPVSDSGN